MMKHSKRFLCLLLTLILAASLCVLPGSSRRSDLPEQPGAIRSCLCTA